MRPLALGCVAWLLAWAAAGCGTARNFNGGVLIPWGLHESRPAPFGGVALDMEHLKDLLWEPKSSGPYVGNLVVSLLPLADLPLSAAGDVITLPWVLMHLGKMPPTTEPRYIEWPPPDYALSKGADQSQTSP